MGKARKIPKRGPARYKHAYNVGYRAGKNYAAKNGVSVDARAEEKQARHASNYKQGPQKFINTYKEPLAVFPPPTDVRIWKWEGFAEAMQLIASAKQ